MTKVKLDLVSDVDMYLFLEKGGGEVVFLYISKRYSKANNKYLTSYDPKKQHVIYTVMLHQNLFQQVDLSD